MGWQPAVHVTPGLNWLYYWGHFRKIACKIFSKPPPPYVTTHFPFPLSFSTRLSLLSLIISHPSTIPTKEHHLRSSPTSFQPPFSGQLIRNILKAAPICCTVFRPAHLPPSSHRFPASNPPPTTRREQHATLLLSSATAPICCLSLHIQTDLLLSVSLSEPMSKI